MNSLRWERDAKKQRPPRHCISSLLINRNSSEHTPTEAKEHTWSRANAARRNLPLSLVLIAHSSQKYAMVARSRQDARPKIVCNPAPRSTALTGSPITQYALIGFKSTENAVDHLRDRADLWPFVRWTWNALLARCIDIREGSQLFSDASVMYAASQ